MQRSKRIYTLLGVLAVSCIATFAVLKVEEKKEQISNSDEVILEISTDSVQALSWDYEDTSLAFHKDDQWLYDEDSAFPVDEEKMEELLEQFQSFGVSFIIEDVEDYAQYGLEDPLCTIHLETEDQSYDILLGNYSNMDSERYVSIGDGNVYLVSEDPLDYFDTQLSDMIDHDETPSFDTVEQITFTGEEDYSVFYEEDSTETYQPEDVYFTKKNGKNLPLDTDRVDTYLNEITTMDLTDYVTYNATEEELQSYGLDDPELTVAVDYTVENEDGEETDETFVLNISRDPEEKQAEKEDSETDEDSEDDESEEEITAYARVGESQIVYQISGSDYEALMAASYDSLRHPEVLSADFSDVTELDITLEGKEYTITSEKDDDTRTYYYGEEELEIDDLQSAVEALSADSFTEEEPDQKEEISLTVHLDNEYFPEVQIQLYRYDGNYCLAVVDGESVSLVERSYVIDLVEAVNAIVLN